jgi:plastocyanin
MEMEEKEKGQAQTAVPKAPAVREVTLVTEDGVLRVNECYANPGDTIRWKADNRKVSIWFPTPGVFSAPALTNKSTGNIDVKVPFEAKNGTYYYVIYCHDTDEFAECASHPKLVIPVPGP